MRLELHLPVGVQVSNMHRPGIAALIGAALLAIGACRGEPKLAAFYVEDGSPPLIVSRPSPG
jgi:hypothetical protein